MSTRVVAIRPPDDTWKKMKAAWDACVAAGTDPPDKVQQFFNHESPDEAGVVVEIEKTVAVRKWSAEMQSGFEVDISKLPEGVKIIRFYNSY